MENPEEILHSLEEFTKLRPKNIPRELEDYLCFVAKTGDPVYQWSVIKCLFREKLINVITEFYESCPSVDIPPCRNVDIFNYDTMKTFILEKLDTFVSAPFTVQRICELLTMPRKEYNRIDKYMRALEKNILVVSTTEPGNHRTPENGDGIVNGIESDHVQDGSNDINIEEMDDGPIWPSYQSTSKDEQPLEENIYNDRSNHTSEQQCPAMSSQNLETVICGTSNEPVLVTSSTNSDLSQEADALLNDTEEKLDVEGDNSISTTEETTETVPAIVQRRRTSIEPPTDEVEPESCQDSNPSFDKEPSATDEPAPETPKLEEEEQEVPVLPKIGDEPDTESHAKPTEPTLPSEETEAEDTLTSTSATSSSSEDTQFPTDSIETNEINVTEITKEEPADNSTEMTIEIQKCTSTQNEEPEKSETCDAQEAITTDENLSSLNAIITTVETSPESDNRENSQPTSSIIVEETKEETQPKSDDTEQKPTDNVDTTMDVDTVSELDTALDAIPSDSTDSADSNN